MAARLISAALAISAWPCNEIGHTLGVGTAPNYWSFIQNGLWTGAQAIAQVRQFDGPSANVNTGTENFRRMC